VLSISALPQSSYEIAFGVSLQQIIVQTRTEQLKSIGRSRCNVSSPQSGLKGEVSMKIDGRCHCGYITYQAEIDPGNVLVCHCTDCQTLSGSAFRTVVLTREDGFKLLSGEPKVYV